MPEEVVATGEQAEETVQETTTEQVPETVEQLQGRLDTAERERADALKQKDEAQGLIGRHTEELNQLRNDNAYYRNQGQQQVPQGQATGSQVGTPVEYDPYDEASVKQFHANQQKQMTAQMNQFAGYMQQQAVGSALNRGKQVIAQNPEVFKGNENEVITMVTNLANSGNIQPDLLENPTTWFGVNDMVKGDKARKQTAGQAAPFASTPVETPSQVKTPEPQVKVDNNISQKIVDVLFDGDREAATKHARESAERGEK